MNAGNERTRQCRVCETTDVNMLRSWRLPPCYEDTGKTWYTGEDKEKQGSYMRDASATAILADATRAVTMAVESEQGMRPTQRRKTEVHDAKRQGERQTLQRPHDRSSNHSHDQEEGARTRESRGW